MNKQCIQCHTQLRPQAKFCTSCGTAQLAASQDQPSQPSSPLMNEVSLNSLNTVFENPTELIKSVRHPNSDSRATLAYMALAGVAFVLLFLLYASPAIVLVYGIFIWFLLWLSGRTAEAALLMGSVEVNEKNFPELFSLIQKVRQLLQYEKEVPAYVLDGKVQIGLLSILRTKRLIISSSVLADNPPKEQLIFAVTHHITRLKAKHDYFGQLTEFIDGVESAHFLNVFLYPYERATAYTADRVAAIVAGKAEHGKNYLVRTMVGNHAAKEVSFSGIQSQAERARGFFAWLARLPSPTPGTTHRIVELKNFEQVRADLFVERHRVN